MKRSDVRLDMEPADALHTSGWSVGLTAFATEGGGLVWVVSGHNGENLIRAEGLTSSAAWQAALDEARAVGMAPNLRVSEPGPG